MRWQKMDDDFFQGLDFVAFDTETTGLWAPVNRIVELGAVKFRLGSNRPDVFSELVNPERRIPPEVIRVHGISDSMVSDADTIGPVLERFFEFCGPESILIAHNAKFDISFVGCEMSRAGLPMIPNRVLDTVDICKQYYPGLDSYSLLSLSQEFAISRTQNHRAADDAALVWKLFSKVSEAFPYIKSDSLLRREFNFYSMAQWQGDTPELPEEFAELERAIDEELTVDIVYGAPGRRPEERRIRPLRVHSLKNTTYIAAYCEKVEDERTFRLDRIKRFTLVD